MHTASFTGATVQRADCALGFESDCAVGLSVASMTVGGYGPFVASGTASESDSVRDPFGASRIWRGTDRARDPSGERRTATVTGGGGEANSDRVAANTSETGSGGGAGMGTEMTPGRHG